MSPERGSTIYYILYTIYYTRGRRTIVSSRSFYCAARITYVRIYLYTRYYTYIYVYSVLAVCGGVGGGYMVKAGGSATAAAAVPAAARVERFNIIAAYIAAVRRRRR